VGASARLASLTERLEGDLRPAQSLIIAQDEPYVDVAHAEALRSEAVKRMRERGAGRMDSSAVLREVLDAWLKQRR
jgi:hypothetical protein